MGSECESQVIEKCHGPDQEQEASSLSQATSLMSLSNQNNSHSAYFMGLFRMSSRNSNSYPDSKTLDIRCILQGNTALTYCDISSNCSVGDGCYHYCVDEGEPQKD